MSDANQHHSTASFYDSPAAAMRAPAEEFLYVACLHRGTGVEKPDFLAVVDAEEGRIVHETPMPKRRRRAAPLRLEPLQLGVPRPRPLAPDRPRLPLVADPHPQRRRRPAARRGSRQVIEPEELVERDGLHAPAHGPLHAGRQRRRSACSATPKATAPAASPCSTRRPSRSRVAGRTAARRRRSTTTSGTSRARTCSSRRSSASRTPTSRASTSRTSTPAATGAGSISGTSTERTLEQTLDLGENGLAPVRGALAARPRGRAGLRRSGAVQHDVALPPRERRLGRPSR